MIFVCACIFSVKRNNLSHLEGIDAGTTMTWNDAVVVRPPFQMPCQLCLFCTHKLTL